MSQKLKDQACAVVRHAEARGLGIVTAESCTAGALATLLADTPGAGDCFHGGFVTYTKACKKDVLNVSPDLIDAHTAVSPEVAEAMAHGALDACAADIAVAVTCVVGPKPDDDGNPVGLTHICTATRDRTIHAELRADGASREDNRERALSAALTLVERALSELDRYPAEAAAAAPLFTSTR